MSLFGHKKRIQCTESHPDAYFRSQFLSKTNYEGIEFAAKVAHTSRIRMTNEIIERGLRSFYGEGLAEEIREKIEAHEQNRAATLSVFVKELRKLAKEQFSKYF